MPTPFDVSLTWADAFWIASAIIALYLARTWARAAIGAAFDVLIRFLRLLGRSATRFAYHCAERHRLLLVHLQAEELESYVESRCRRVDGLFHARLAHYPALHHRLSAAVGRFEHDCRAAIPAGAAPVTAGGSPPAPAMLEAPPAAAGLPAIDEPMPRPALRARTARRLTAMRGDLTALRDLDRRIDAARREVNAGVAEYKALLAGEPRRTASAGRSAVVLVIVGLLVGLAVLGGAALNFRLIARPLSEIVGEGFQVFGYPLSDALALGLILVEAVAGALFMDFLGVTRLFPVADRLEDRHRRMLAAAVGCVILAFALIEASLALVREDIVQLERQLGPATGSSGAAPPAAAPGTLGWLPQVVQASLGFIMPWVLALVAIPLEQLLKYGRVVLQAAGAAGFGALAALLRVVVGVLAGLRALTLRLYDLAVFLPLFLESMVRRRKPAPVGRRDDPAC